MKLTNLFHFLLSFHDRRPRHLWFAMPSSGGLNKCMGETERTDDVSTATRDRVIHSDEYIISVLHEVIVNFTD